MSYGLAGRDCMGMKVAIGCDHRGLPLKREIIALLQERKIDFQDFGVCTTDEVDYPDIAERVAEAIQHSEFDRGILVCGQGIGMVGRPHRDEISRVVV